MATVSDKPWGGFTPADYTPEQFARACLIDTGQGAPDSKDRYRCPVREPDGTLNRGGVHAAAGGHGISAVTGVSAAVKLKAARDLISLYKTCGDAPPDSLMQMADMMGSRARPDPAEAMYRAFNPHLEIRTGDGTGRTIYGIAVPYGAPTFIDSPNFVGIEQFARGAFNHQLRSPNRVKLAREHEALGGTLIGAASLMRDDPAGLYVEMRVAHTPAGDETLALVRDGALDELSIAFRARQDRKLAGGVTERVQADLSEVAIVRQGAYGELAAAIGVRSARGMPVAADDLDLRAASEEFLTPGALPDPPDPSLEIRWLNLGMP